MRACPATAEPFLSPPPQDRSLVRGQLRAVGAALTFLTRIPWAAQPREGWDADDLARATTYFPLVGAVVGAWGGAIYWVATTLWPGSVAIVLSTIGTVWLTGALHEDGLADTADGFGSGWGDRDRVLAIMKDSRIGTYGAIALILAVAGKLTTLLGLASPEAVIRALIAGHTLARWSSLPLLWRGHYLRDARGTGAAFARSVPFARLVEATLITIVIVRLSLGTAVGIFAAIPAIVVTAAAGWYFHHRIGGITGDCLGATNQCVELATYLALLAY